MGMTSFKAFKDRHPSVDTDTLVFQYDAYKALKRAYYDINVLNDSLVVGEVPVLLCSTATVEIREKVAQIQKDLTEVSIKLRIVQERLSRTDRELAEQALEARLIKPEVEMESERDRVRSEFLDRQMKKHST